jgi:hypothetical protein
MCFLDKPFQHDLFVSYSHGDVDRSGESKLKTWSQAFARELEGELRQAPKFGEVTVFLDQHRHPSQSVDPTVQLTKKVKDEVGAAALLIVLMSPHYLLSKWCGDERDWWLACQPNHRLATDGRIVVARIWPTDPPWSDDPWPPTLADERGHPLVGFTFYDLKNAVSRPWPYNWPDPTDAKGPFRDVLLDMVGRIWDRLRNVKKQLEEQARRKAEAERLSAASGQIIYLHARTNDAEAWGRARQVLTERRFIVQPSEPDLLELDPERARKIKEQRVQTLTRCDGLLLLGANDGDALEADLVAVGHRDRQLARALSERLLPCAVLDTTGLGNATQERKETAQSLGIDWIDATSEVWPTAVQSWLNEASAARERV